MVFKSFDAESTVMAVFIFAALSVFLGNSSSFGEFGMLQGAGYLVHLPFSIALAAIGTGAPLLVVGAFLAFLLYLGLLGQKFGEGIVALGIFASIALSVGV